MNRRDAGRLGGKAHTARKKRAAQANGAKGGRPPKTQATDTPMLFEKKKGRPAKWKPTDYDPQETRTLPLQALRLGYVKIPDGPNWNVERSDDEQRNWETAHGTYPLPRMGWRIVFFRDTLAYHYFSQILAIRPEYQFTEVYVQGFCTDRHPRVVWAIWCALHRDKHTTQPQATTRPLNVSEDDTSVPAPRQPATCEKCGQAHDETESCY